MPGGQAEAEAEEVTRRNAFPEALDYEDTGCEIHPACLTCPLLRCRYDEPGGLKTIRLSARDKEIARAREAGRSLAEITRRFGLSRRSVFRRLALARQGEGLHSGAQSSP